MDRRTFALTLSGMALGLIGCRDAADPLGPGTPPEPPEPEPHVPQPPYPTAADRAFGVADGLVAAAEQVDDGVRWRVTGSSAYPTNLYTGQAGVLTFLAETYRIRPDPAVRGVMEAGGRWLRARPPDASAALYEGNAGRAWAFLSLHQALGGDGDPWLQAALGLAPGIAGATSGLIGDIINGAPGQGLLLIRLYTITGDDRWLTAATHIADRMLDSGVTIGDGLKFPSFVLPDGQTVYYTGLSHGSAGAGYFLCRLAELLPAEARAPYLDAAERVAVWLDDIAIPHDDGVNWYRREPDQMQTRQVQWCHGAPGIGIFHAELHRLTAHDPYLTVARRCATLVREQGRLSNACQCHGLAGNAELFLTLHRQTGEDGWLSLAREFGDLVWSRRFTHTYHPAWPSGDGQNADNPGLMTGNAGVGWFYLQLATDGAVGMPVT